MKCEGAEDPRGCKRCWKVGRECISQSRSRTSNELQDFSHRDGIRQAHASNLHPDRPSNAIVSIHSPVRQSITPYRAQARHSLPLVADYSPRAQIGSELPSIYSTPPVENVDNLSEENRYHDLPQSAPARKRKRHTDIVSPANGDLTTSPASFLPEINITKHEMREMIQLFCQRHLPYIPALQYEDWENVDSLIQKELPFVYCICYVTARYLPGGREIREMLLPEVTRYPREIFSPRHDGRVDDWIILKGLIVLFSYADLTPPTQRAKSIAEQDIGYVSTSYLTLKYCPETY